MELVGKKREITSDAVYKELKRFKNSALGDTNTLLGSEQCLMPQATEEKDDCNTDFLQEMKTISTRSLKQQLKIKCLTNTQNFHSFQSRKAQSRFIKVNSFCKPGANGYYIFCKCYRATQQNFVRYLTAAKKFKRILCFSEFAFGPNSFFKNINFL